MNQCNNCGCLVLHKYYIKISTVYWQCGYCEGINIITKEIIQKPTETQLLEHLNELLEQQGSFLYFHKGIFITLKSDQFIGNAELNLTQEFYIWLDMKLKELGLKYKIDKKNKHLKIED